MFTKIEYILEKREIVKLFPVCIVLHVYNLLCIE